jgi:two-component sensor histidine kinase
VVVPHQPQGATEARQRLVHELGNEVGPELLADAGSVVAELVGNAVTHARPLPGNVVRVAWRLCRDTSGIRLQVWVTDGGAPDDQPRPQWVAPEAVQGRGLAIVTAIADRWGVRLDGLAQSVWAELRWPRRTVAGTRSEPAVA